MTQTLRRERRLKFEGILTGKLIHESELSLLCELLADAAVSETERRTDETFGEYKTSSIYKIYQENIGLITPIIADQLKEIEDAYPDGWFEDAVKEALKANVRKLNYVVSILERWKVDGKGDKKKEQPTEYRPRITA